MLKVIPKNTADSDSLQENSGFCDDDGFASKKLIEPMHQQIQTTPIKVILGQEWYCYSDDCINTQHHSFTNISLMPFLCTLPASSLIIDSLTIQHQNKKTSCSNCKQYLYHNYSFICTHFPYGNELSGNVTTGLSH